MQQISTPPAYGDISTYLFWIAFTLAFVFWIVDLARVASAPIDEPMLCTREPQHDGRCNGIPCEGCWHSPCNGLPGEELALEQMRAEDDGMPPGTQDLAA